MEINDAISYVLRIGVVASSLLIILGTVLLFIGNGSNGFSLSEIASANTQINSSMFSISDIISGTFVYQGMDFMLLGLMVLIATPVVRVLLSIFAFLHERNWLYAAITLIVFIDLMVAVLIVPGLLTH